MTQRLATGAFLLLSVLLFPRAATAEVTLETDNLRLQIGDDAVVKSVAARESGAEYGWTADPGPMATVTRDGKIFPASSVTRDGNKLTVEFAKANVTAQYELSVKPQYLAFKLVSLKGEPIDAIQLLRLKIKKLPYLGYWINAAYDDRFGICLCAGNVQTNALMSRRGLMPDESRPEVLDAIAAERRAQKDFVVMRAVAEKEVALEGAVAVLFGFPRPPQARFLDPDDPFLAIMEIVERDFDMPSGAKGRRSPLQNASWIEIGSLNPENIDEHIEMAKRGGFRILKYSWGTYSYGPGHFTFRKKTFPNGMADLKKLNDKIHAAGLNLAMHLHYNKATKQDAYVTPVPDDRLGKVRHFTLAEPVDAKADTISVNENPAGCTKGHQRRILKADDELIYYTDYTTEPPFKFTGCERGHLKTKAAAHKTGDAVDLLDVDTYYLFIRFAQDNDIQDETARRIARIYREAGPYELIYYDGAEDVPSPLWFHVPNAQVRVFQLLKPEPSLSESAVNGHFSWHTNPRSNAYDAAPAPTYKDFCRKVMSRTAPVRAIDFSRAVFGWMYKFEFTPDTLEYVTSQAAAWDCPCGLMVPTMDMIKANPRWEDCLDVFKIWEDIRADQKLTEAQRRMLRTLTPDCYRDCDACEHHIWRNILKEPGLSEAAKKKLMTIGQEHHLFKNEQGEYELVPVEEIPHVGMDFFTAYSFTRESRPNDTYVLVWAKADEDDLRLNVPAERLTVMRPFATEVPFQADGKQSSVTVGSRKYLLFKNMGVDQARELVRKAGSSAQPKRIFIPGAEFASQSGHFIRISKTGTKAAGALSDGIVPTVKGTFEAWEKCYADYAFDVKSAGRWRLWARIRCKDHNSDSLFTSLPNQPREKQILGNRPCNHCKTSPFLDSFFASM